MVQFWQLELDLIIAGHNPKVRRRLTVAMGMPLDADARHTHHLRNKLPVLMQPAVRRA